MRNIQVTEEQKINLLIMMRILFPEYEHLFLDDDNGFLMNMWYDDKNLLHQTLSIHWFEFCMIHLMKALNSSWYNYRRWINEEGDTHLIDYLYDEFKRTKV